MINRHVVEEEVSSITWDYSYRYSNILLPNRLLWRTWKTCKTFEFGKKVWYFETYESLSGESVILPMETCERGLQETAGVVKENWAF